MLVVAMPICKWFFVGERANGRRRGEGVAVLHERSRGVALTTPPNDPSAAAVRNVCLFVARVVSYWNIRKRPALRGSL